MKKLVWATALSAALAVVLAVVGCLLGSVSGMAGNETLYGERSRLEAGAYIGAADEEALSQYIGLTEGQQADYAREAAAYMRAKNDPGEFDPKADGVSILSMKERQHMRDVRGLVRLADSVSKVCMYVAAGLAVVAAWTGLTLKQGKKTALMGALLGLGLAAVIGGAVGMAAKGDGFTKLFYGFHELAFANDLWLLNPETDILIRMMPESLFVWAAGQVIVRTGTAFALAAAMLAVIYLVVGGILKRNIEK